MLEEQPPPSLATKDKTHTRNKKRANIEGICSWNITNRTVQKEDKRLLPHVIISIGKQQTVTHEQRCLYIVSRRSELPVYMCNILPSVHCCAAAIQQSRPASVVSVTVCLLHQPVCPEENCSSTVSCRASKQDWVKAQVSRSLSLRLIQTTTRRWKSANRKTCCHQDVFNFSHLAF